MDRVESAIRLVLDFHEALNRHDVAGMMALTTDDCLYESTIPAPDGTSYSGKEEVSRFWKDFFHSSQQASMEIEELVGFGIRCALRWRIAWVDSSGWRRSARGVDLFKMRDKLICQQLSYTKGSLF